MSEAMEQVVTRERFVVDNDMKAEWCLSKIRKIREKQKRETAELERQMQFYQDQMEIVKHSADEDAAFFEGILREYFEKRVEEGFTKATKTKVTYKLPTGNLILKHYEPEYRRDEKTVIDWLKKEHNSEFIKVEEKLDWAGLKKEVQVNGAGCVNAETGEVIPGIEVVDRNDEFVVEVK